MEEKGQALLKSQSTLFMLAKKMSIQLSSEQFVGDIWIAQLNRKPSYKAVSSGVNLALT